MPEQLTKYWKYLFTKQLKAPLNSVPQGPWAAPPRQGQSQLISPSGNIGPAVFGSQSSTFSPSSFKSTSISSFPIPKACCSFFDLDELSPAWSPLSLSRPHNRSSSVGSFLAGFRIDLSICLELEGSRPQSSSSVSLDNDVPILSYVTKFTVGITSTDWFK